MAAEWDMAAAQTLAVQGTAAPHACKGKRSRQHWKLRPEKA
jgi:hypothetical protein